jgi:hypothetical protein
MILENDNLERIVFARNVDWNWGKMLWKFLNDESSLWKVVNGKNTSF